MPRATFGLSYHRALTSLGCALALATDAGTTNRVVLTGHVPKALVRLKPISALAETNRLRLALGLPLRHQDRLDALLRGLYDPSGAQFHQYLKPSEFAARFGPTESDYEVLAAFARSHGLSVVKTYANRLLLDVEGTVGNVQEAFHVKMNVFRHPTDKRTFYSPDTEPSVEAALPLVHISGLNNLTLPKPNLITQSGLHTNRSNGGTGQFGTFAGHDFRAAYMPGVTLDGSGQSIALVEFDTFYTNDIAEYESMTSLPNVPVTTIPIDGFNSAPGKGGPEVSVDIELSISMAPGISQVLVYSADYGVSTSVNDDLLNQIAMDDLANQVVCCWGYDIDATTDFIFQEMAAQGQSFFDACGDVGSYDMEVPPLHGDPFITVVGGTSLATSSPGGPWAGESVWNYFSAGDSIGSGSSGGISSTYAVPYWQQAVNFSSNQGSAYWRNVPDVAMAAADIMVICRNGSVVTGAGTSCAAPLWAGLTALINQQGAQYGRAPVGFLNPAIYGVAQSGLYPSIFHDITAGNNTNSNDSTKFFAVPGYDLCTGWGTPTGQALINALASPDNLTLAPGSGAAFISTNGVALSSVTKTMVFKNTGVATINWVMGPVPNWLSVTTNQGVLLPGLATFVTISTTAAATNLSPGAYMTNLLITNLIAGVAHLFPVFLQVADPLIVSPTSGLALTGPVGGPFNETTQVFSLSNAAAAPINWTAQSTSTFANFSPSGGTLPAGSSTNITAALSSGASNLLIGAQSGLLLFTDLSTTNTQSRAFTLAVGNGGFETGDFSDWTFVGLAGGYSMVLGVPGFYLDYVHSGAYAATMGQPYTMASLSQMLPTVPGQLYLLTLFLDNPVGGPTNQFAVQWGGATLYNETNVPQMFWEKLQFAVFATNSVTTLELDARNDPDAFGLDDISVTPVAPPIFSSVTASNGVIHFNWSATPGFNYQLQYTTSLAAPLWTSSGAAITASSSLVTTTDTQPTDPQRFYRIVLTSP